MMNNTDCITITYSAITSAPITRQPAHRGSTGGQERIHGYIEMSGFRISNSSGKKEMLDLSLEIIKFFLQCYVLS